MIVIIRRHRYDGRAPRFHNGDQSRRQPPCRPSFVNLRVKVVLDVPQRMCRRGVSLVEILVLIAFLAVISTFAFPLLVNGH